MTPEDRALARDALLRKRLTIEQVSEVQKECDATRRPFAEVAVRRGLLTPEDAAAIPAPRPTPVPRLFPGLIAGTLVILAALVVVGLLHVARRNEQDKRLAEESIANIAEAERRAREARQAYEREQIGNREADAARALEKARGIMKFAEERFRDAPAEPQLHLHLVEATLAFNAYLEAHPEAAGVFVERSRAYELRRDFERALADLDRAIELKKDLAPGLDAKVQELRLQVARPKK